MKKRSSRRVAALAVAAVIALGSRETAMTGETSRSLFGVFVIRKMEMSETKK